MKITEADLTAIVAVAFCSVFLGALIAICCLTPTTASYEFARNWAGSTLICIGGFYYWTHTVKKAKPNDDVQQDKP